MGGGSSPFGTSDFIGVGSSSTRRSIGKLMRGSVVAGTALTIVAGENTR